MSLSPAIIDAMVASGCTVEQMAAVMKAAIAGEELRLADKRAKDAERQRRHRASRDVTVTECDNADSVTDPSLSRPPNEKISNPPTHTHPENNTRAREADPFPRPAWCADQLWRDLKANRKAKHLACTPTAHTKLLRDIEKYTNDEWPPGRVLEAAVGRGWAAVPSDPRDAEHDRSPRQFHRQAQPTTREIGERLAASFATGGDGVVDLVPRLGAASWHDR